MQDQQIWVSVEGHSGEVIRFAIDKSFLEPSVIEEDYMEDDLLDGVVEDDVYDDEAPIEGSFDWDRLRWKVFFTLVLLSVVYVYTINPL